MKGSTAMRVARALAAGAAALALAGCAEFTTLRTAAQPTDLYTLTPKSTFPPDLPSIRQQIVVETPTATASVNSDRIAVMPNLYQVQYLPGARWVDRAPLMVQTLLIESFENSGRVAAVGRSAVGLRADYVLITDLREFQARLPPESEPDAPLEALVRLNVKVVSAYDDRIVASESFESTSTAASAEAIDVVTAFDEALGSTMKSAVEWTVRRIDDFGERRLSF